jgi:hypothetical protein
VFACIDVAEGEAEGTEKVCGGLGMLHRLCHLSWVVSEVASWQEGGVTYLGSPTLSLWAWVGVYTAFSVFVVLLALAFIILSCLLAVNISKRGGGG